jgi:SOS response regulatory protein OraA/RecX
MMTSRSNVSERDALRLRALSALTRSEKTRAQLITLLSRHAPEEQVLALMDALQREGLLSDERASFSKARASRAKGHTAARATQDLVELGVEPSVAARAVEEAYGDSDEAAQLRSAVAALGPSPSRAQREKAARALLRRGFDPDAVARCLSLDGEMDPG